MSDQKSERINDLNNKEIIFKRRYYLKRILLMLLMLLFVLACAFLLYAEKYYHADASAAEALASDETVTVEQTGYGWFFDGPSSEDGLIFYPGGKVEETAYAPFLKKLAAGGLDVCLVKMPFRLAVLDLQAAERILPQYSYERWYIGGHSLGGAMAASFAAEHEKEVNGVILCAAYPTAELDDSYLEITVYGSEDRIVNREKIERGRTFAPDVSEEYVIEGGNHAQFGNYGIQKGDGTARISVEEQQTQAAERILETLRRQEKKSA